MPRIRSIDPATASGEAKDLLDAVRGEFGAVPNFVRVLANSPKALAGFLGLHAGVSGGNLDKATQERIALALAESNGCQYCVSAHTAIGRGAGLGDDEMRLNRQGGSSDSRAAAAVVFAKALNDHGGDVTASEIDAVRKAGYSDAEIVDIIAVVALNIFTNVLGKSLAIDIDFPKVALLARSDRAAA